MKLYVDDIRNAPDETWTLVRTISEAIKFLALYGMEVTHISLDHDISFPVYVDGTTRPYPSKDTFATVAYYIARTKQYFDEMSEWRPDITIHTSNPDGAETIYRILKDVGIEAKVEPMGAAFRPKIREI
jgi:hypothetical protein